MRGFLLAVWIGSVFFATSAGAVNRTESAVKKRNVAAADTSVVASAQQQAPAGRSGAAADSRPVPPETLSVLSEETGVTSGAVPVVTKELSVSKPDSMQGKTHAPADSMEMAVDSMSGDSTVKKGFFHRFYNYFKSANVDKTLTKKFDFSIIGGPHYSSDIKLGLGLVAAGLYRVDRKDLSIPPSNISLFGDITTTGFWLLGVRGNTLFKGAKYRLDFTTYFFSFPSAFWGIGYNKGMYGTPGSYKRMQSQVKVDFFFRLVPKFRNFIWDRASASIISRAKIFPIFHCLTARIRNIPIRVSA